MRVPHPRLGRLAAAAVGAAVFLSSAACAGGGDDGGEPAEAERATAPETTLQVLAPSSLTEAFTAVAEQFEEVNDGVDVSISFGGSPSLVTQLAQGAPADVLATADEESMARAVDGGDAVAPVAFTRNRLTLVVERGNPQRVRGVQDLARPDLVLVACASEVPCGRLASRVLAAASVSATPRSQEENVKAVLAKVTLGEADAGLVYETDAEAAGDEVERVDVLPKDPSLTTAYPIAVTTDAGDGDLARRWIAYVRSPAGQQVLADHGFLPA